MRYCCDKKYKQEARRASCFLLLTIDQMLEGFDGLKVLLVSVFVIV